MRSKTAQNCLNATQTGKIARKRSKTAQYRLKTALEGPKRSLKRAS